MGKSKVIDPDAFTDNEVEIAVNIYICHEHSKYLVAGKAVGPVVSWEDLPQDQKDRWMVTASLLFTNGLLTLGDGAPS